MMEGKRIIVAITYRVMFQVILLASIFANICCTPIRQYDDLLTPRFVQDNTNRQMQQKTHLNAIPYRSFEERYSSADEGRYESNDDLLYPTDFQFIRRRNDRIELLRRYAKSINEVANVTDMSENKPKQEEIVLFIETINSSTDKSTTTKSKKNTTKKAKPNKSEIKIHNKNNQISDGEDVIIDGVDTESNGNIPQIPLRPQNNNMSGQSQIGNRESQMVIKPTVIVNFRGSVSNKDSEIRLEGRNNEDNSTLAPNPPQNVFNINQDIKIERTYAILDETEDYINHPRKITQKKIREKNFADINREIVEFKNGGTVNIDITNRETKSLRDNLNIIFKLKNNVDEGSFAYVIDA